MTAAVPHRGTVRSCRLGRVYSYQSLQDVAELIAPGYQLAKITPELLRSILSSLDISALLGPAFGQGPVNVLWPLTEV